jgi:hypothetical protein
LVQVPGAAIHAIAQSVVACVLLDAAFTLIYLLA